MEKKLITIDGNEAAANMAYDFTEIAAIYPITPSSPMAEHTDFWSAKGRKNMFGQTVTLTEMQSEAGAIAAVHGAAQTGSLATSFTSSQGLMLMIPVLHRIAGERLPVVLHVAARTVGTHAMSIFGDHSDVMCCRNTGFAMLCSGSVQEVIDLASVAHLAAIKGSTPFMHFFDGFRTSHEINTAEMIDTSKLRDLVDQRALAAFRNHALNPEHPLMRSTVQNPDVFFQVREACNPYYDKLPEIVEDYLTEINNITGRDYHLFNYYGAPDAEYVIVTIGSVSGLVRSVVDELRRDGVAAGLLKIRYMRPFPDAEIAEILRGVKAVGVLEKDISFGYEGTVFTNVNSALQVAGLSVRTSNFIGGLGGADISREQIRDIFQSLESDGRRLNFLGINREEYDD